MTQMGKRGIDVSRSSSRSRVRSAFNGLVKLGLVFLVVVLLSNVVVAKDFDATVTKFHQCLNSENGIMDSQHLCLKDSFEIENGETAIGKDVCFRGKNSANEVTVYDEEVCESTACLDTSSGREEIEVVHRINQMYAELFHDILVQLDDQGVKDEPNTKDVRDAAAITAELFFGNGDYCGGTSDHTECEKNDGFATDGQNGDNNPGNENEQPTASSACLRIKNDQPVYSIDVDDWGVAGPDKFGFEETGKDKFSELSTVPLVLKCYSEEESKVHPWGEGNAKYFDIRGGFASDNTYPDDAIEEVTEGLFVSQKFIYTDPNSSDQITKYNLYFCENGQWKDYDYIKNLDDDGDGAPGEYGVVWDCDDNNPTVAPDYSAFEGLVSNPIEVCGDGKSNFCENSTLYEEFYDAYESIYEDWPNTYSEEQDDCDYNPWACENNCLFVNNHCDYLDYSSIDEESEEFEQPSMAEGFCCGADQIEDLGRIADPEFIDEIDESKVCLHKDNEYMVGGDLENLIGCEDNDEWCWAGANTNGFKIFTIKEVGIEPFDIISNTDDWYSCNENTTEETLQTPSALEDRDKANRFMCYDQGDRFVWAECADPENAGTVKHRLPGDGTYMLANFMEDGGDIRFDDYSSDTSFFYKQDLVKTQFVDFKEYDFIEFYAAINEIPDLPADVRLQIYGKNDVIYFDEQVLGYSVNAPLMTEGNQIHVKVPIGGWLDVELINIYGEPSSANIDIKNVYLSKEGEETPICSGYVTDSVNFNSWLENLDQSEEGNEVVGDKICMEHFGEDAWLGHSDYNEVDEDSASCCGNTASEYYAGLTADNDGRGCWNSEVVNNDETAMNVEYDLTYSNNEYVVEYPVQEFDLADTYQTVSVEWECDVNADLGDYDSACDQQGINCQNTEIECSTTYRPSQDCIETYSRCNNLGCASREFTVSCTEGEYADNYISVVSLLDEINFGEVGYYGTYPDGNYYEIDEGSAIYSLSYNESPMVISETEYSLNSLLENSEEGEFTFTLPFDQAQYPTVKVYYFLPGTQRKQTGNEFTVRRGEVPEQFTLQIIAETDEMTSTPDPQTVTESFNHACLQDECIFGLPGIPPYYITNLHPGLYELYYITGSNPEDEVLVTTENQQFNDFANLKVKKLSQQVLYSNQTFYGCNAASFIADDTNIPGLENVNYCTAQGSYYCAYQDDNYLINTWSNVGITEYGYEEIAEYEEDMEFEPASCLTGDPCAAEDLNFSTHIVPGRNFINNPDFEEQDNNDVIGWELLDSNNYLVENEDANAADGTFNIPSENTLRTERLALYPKMDYVFTQASSCIATLKLYDKDGAETITSTTFNSTDNTYIVIEFAGSCSLSEPMLQLVDDLGAKEFDAEDTEYPLRKAAACCPEGWCWNGYLCVESMSSYTYLTEQVNDTHYRCIDGVWDHTEPKYDWNGDQWGFCSSELQCYVTSSLSEGADPDANLSDFYEGTYPTCVNEGDYLMDHYCEEGNWSSRTKYLASKMLEFAGSDDYVLYCTDPRINLIDYDVEGYNYANYVAGEVSADVDQESGLGEAVTGQESSSSTTSVCFSALTTSETGKRLVPTEDNTCINNVCVLKYKSGDEFITAFATSMNYEKDNDQSFFIPLGYSSSELETLCTTGTGDFVECSDELWYSEEINSLIYGKNGISVQTSLLDNVLNWFLGLFGETQVEQTETFFEDAGNFNEIYVLSMGNGDQVVRALEEISAEGNTLVAEYQGFDFPICDYVNNINEEYVLEYQWPASPEYLVSCNLTEEGIYSVMTQTNTDFWWPQLTGKLRTGMS